MKKSGFHRDKKNVNKMEREQDEQSVCESDDQDTVQVLSINGYWEQSSVDASGHWYTCIHVAPKKKMILKKSWKCNNTFHYAS